MCKIAQDYNIKIVHRLKEGKYIILGRIMFVRVSSPDNETSNDKPLVINPVSLYIALDTSLFLQGKEGEGGMGQR